MIKYEELFFKDCNIIQAEGLYSSNH